MTLREVLNLWGFIMVLLAMLAAFILLNDFVKHSALDYGEAGFMVLSLAPTILLIVTGQAYGVAFFSGLFWDESKAAHTHYSRERSLARAGQGREAAQGMLWRDKILGDTKGLIAILEMAQLDPGMQPEALRATHRLLSRGRLNKVDRDHVGRLVSLLKISTQTDKNFGR